MHAHIRGHSELPCLNISPEACLNIALPLLPPRAAPHCLHFSLFAHLQPHHNMGGSRTSVVSGHSSSTSSLSFLKRLRGSTGGDSGKDHGGHGAHHHAHPAHPHSPQGVPHPHLTTLNPLASLPRSDSSSVASPRASLRYPSILGKAPLELVTEEDERETNTLSVAQLQVQQSVQGAPPDGSLSPGTQDMQRQQGQEWVRADGEHAA